MDHVAGILAQWARERPDLDVAPMGLVGRVHRLAALLQAELDAGFAAHGLSAGEFDVLATLRRAGAPYELTPTAIAAAAMVTSGAVTKRVDRLLARGWVAREPDPDDARGRRVRLTDTGRALVDDVLAAHVAREERLLGALRPEQRTDLAGLLAAWLVSLE
ncbi:MarR family winged helix-turn-helix transcriptional regulator [Nocardioides sp.]|uniref:MarR family winged helix-turn-helix transcriptional regulator n=1 Tax=Nocardioides sp. TaxID=35761 RepID=UPI0035129AA8